MFGLNNMDSMMSSVYGNESFDEKICERCSMSRSEFLRSGIVGCAHCYDVFKNDVHSALLQKQGNFNHVGKISSKHFSKIKIKEKIEELEKEKDIAAREENFIVAEALKNQIEKLRGELWYERL